MDTIAILSNLSFTTTPLLQVGNLTCNALLELVFILKRANTIPNPIWNKNNVSSPRVIQIPEPKCFKESSS